MPRIIRYRKHTDATTTYQVALPEGAIELCELDGLTYVTLPDGMTLPPPDEKIAASVEDVTLDAPLRKRIKAASPHCQLIAERQVERLRAKYSIDDELYFARVGVSVARGLYTPTAEETQEMADFGDFVESVRQWGRTQRNELGL